MYLKKLIIFSQENFFFKLKVVSISIKYFINHRKIVTIKLPITMEISLNVFHRHKNNRQFNANKSAFLICHIYQT